jgi:hypothetical protein
LRADSKLLVASTGEIPWTSGQQFLDSIGGIVADPGEDFAQISFLCSARDHPLGKATHNYASDWSAQEHYWRRWTE